MHACQNSHSVLSPDKNITISYNYLNLPYRIEWDDGRWVDFMYDASGMKLVKELSTGETQDYVHGIEYANNNLDAIYFEDGRAIPEGNSFEYQYYLRDHLGNTRVMFQDDGNGLAEIVQENHYYSFGLAQNGEWSQPNVSDYTFGGKELNEDFELGWQDFEARWRDPAIIGWGQIDALAGDYMAWSPYNYTLGNPIRFIDPDGKSPTDPPVTKTQIKIGGVVTKDNRSINIFQYANIVKTTTFDDGSKTTSSEHYELNASINSFDGERNLVTGSIISSEVECCIGQDGNQDVNNFYFSGKKETSFSTSDYKDKLGIEGRFIIENVMKELNSEGWNNILISDENTKTLIANLDKATEELGIIGLVSGAGSVIGAIVTKFTGNVKEGQTGNSHFDYEQNIEYEKQGEE